MRNLPSPLLLIPLLLFSVSRAADFPLRDLPVRDAVSLPDWRFQAVPGGVTNEDWSGPEMADEREEWTSVTLPAVWDREPGQVDKRAPTQTGWFRKVVEIPPDWTGGVEIGFLAAKYSADVFVDGEYKLTHRGGYTPFRVPLGPAEDLPESVEVVVRVDNRLSNETAPKSRVGWKTYGGLDREVCLLHRPPVRPERPVVRTRRNENGAWSLSLSADTVGVPGTPLEISLSGDGETVASTRLEDWADGVESELSVDRPALWSPEHPNLYTLTLSWGGDRLSFPVGFRELVWRDGHLYVNGGRTWLRGFGQHEAWPNAGHIGTPEQRRRDLRLMKEAFGANAVRPGHYPNHPDLYNLADELGLLVFSEIPVWQNPSNVLATDRVWDAWLEPQLREMVELARNHPSAMAWGVLNETGGAHAYVARARAFLKELDPDRPVAAVLAATRDLEVGGITDLLARNLHYGWYHARSVYKLRQGLERNLQAAKGKPLWVAELGGMADRGRIGDGYGDGPRGTELYQEKMTRFGLQHVMSRADELAGISLWTLTDFHPNPHGVLNLEREPKLAAYPVANLMRPDRVVLALENERRIPPGGGLEIDLKIFSREPAPGEAVEVDWSLRRGTEILLEGRVSESLSEGWVTDLETIRWPVPADAPPALLHFQAELRNPDGGIRHSLALPVEIGEGGGIGVLRLSPPGDGVPREVTVMGMPMTVYQHVGLILALPPGEVEIRRGDSTRSVTIESGRATGVDWE